MPVVVPERVDREDIEKYIKALTAAHASPDRDKVDRQDYSPVTATCMTGEGYINDEDIWSKIKKAAAAIP